MDEAESRQLVAQGWPHLVALVDLLDALDGRTVTIAAVPTSTDLNAALRHRETMAAPIAP